MTAPDPITRAAAALGVPPDADPAAVREAFLRKLADGDYAPPEGWVAAVNRLGGTAIPLSCEAVASEADATRDEIDAFAVGFWGMDPDSRRAMWNDLHARCPAGPSAAFLNQLEIGLGVAAAPHADEDVEAVANLARELFVLRPRPRAVRRAEWLANHEATDCQKAVAERLAAEQPGVAALDPVLFGRLTGKIGRGEAVGGDRTYLGNEPAFTVSTDVGYDAVSRGVNGFQERLAAANHSTPRPSPSSSPLMSRAALVVVAVVIVRALAGLSGSSQSGNTYSPPAVRYGPPPTLWRPDPAYDRSPNPTVSKYTPNQVLTYLQYRPGSKEPAPPGYYQWVDEQSPNIRDMIFRSVPTRR